MVVGFLNVVVGLSVMVERLVVVLGLRGLGAPPDLTPTNFCPSLKRSVLVVLLDQMDSLEESRGSFFVAQVVLSLKREIFLLVKVELELRVVVERLVVVVEAVLRVVVILIVVVVLLVVVVLFVVVDLKVVVVLIVVVL